MSVSKKMDNLYKFQLSQQLNALGNIACLRQKVNISDFKKHIQPFEEQFKIYNPRKSGYNRYGLSLTSLNGK